MLFIAYISVFNKYPGDVFQMQIPMDVKVEDRSVDDILEQMEFAIKRAVNRQGKLQYHVNRVELILNGN